MLDEEADSPHQELVKGIRERRIWLHLLCTYLVFIGVSLYDFSLALPIPLASKLRLR